MSIPMKKILKYTIIIVVLIAMGAGAFGAYVGGRMWTNKLPNKVKYETVYSMGDYTLETDENGLFRALKINDTHLKNGNCENDTKTLDGLKTVLDSTPVDLIILDGDLIEGFNLDSKYNKENALKKIAELVESYGTPWTFIPGNNDGEIDGSNRAVISYLMGYQNFLAGNVKGLYGDMQFYINISYNGAVSHMIAVMDGGSRKPKVTGKYDNFRENQVEHMVGKVQEKGVKTSLFFHMPTPAFEKAYLSGEQYENMPIRHYEGFDSIKKNEVLDRMIDGESLITLLSAAHQHGNSLCSLYNGRYYELATPSGYNAGRPKDVEPSVTLISIDVKGETAKDIYAFEKIAI